MHRPPPVALAGLLLVAAVAARGADAPPAGTLDQTKAELRQLQNDQKNKAGQSADKVRLDTPTLDLQTTPDSGSPEAWLAKKLKKDRKLEEDKKAQANWLVEGVEKLEQEGSQAKDGAGVAPKGGQGSQPAPHAIDQSDPQYLLKLFDEQKKITDNKPAAAKPAAATPDAFAPFMQSWLSSSPVKGQLSDQFLRKSDSGASNSVPGALPGDYRGPDSAGGPTSVAIASRETASGPKENPYLAELNSPPILGREVMQDAPQLQSLGGAPAVTTEVGKGAPVLQPSAPAADTRERPKGPPPGLTDDKKYFPQLKRF